MIKAITQPNTSGAIAQSGDLVTYAITVFNTGTATISGLFVDTLPSQLSYVSVSVPATVNGQTISIPMTIQPGGFYAVLLTARLNNTYPAGTVYTNTANFTCQFPTACNNASASASGVIL